MSASHLLAAIFIAVVGWELLMWMVEQLAKAVGRGLAEGAAEKVAVVVDRRRIR